MNLVTDYLQHMYKNGRIIGGRVICAVCCNSSNPAINPANDTGVFNGVVLQTAFPPTNEQDANNRIRSINEEYDRIAARLQAANLSMTVVNNTTDGAHFDALPNRINPVFLQQLCSKTNGSFICLDLEDEESKARCKQACLSFLGGEVGYDVPDFPPSQE